MSNEISKQYGSRNYVYNESMALMEWRDDELGTLYSVGLSRDNFNDNPAYWFEAFHNMINEELAYM